MRFYFIYVTSSSFLTKFCPFKYRSLFLARWLIWWEELRIVEAHLDHLEDVNRRNYHKRRQQHSAKLEEELVAKYGPHMSAQRLCWEDSVLHAHDRDWPQERQWDQTCEEEESSVVSNRHEELHVMDQHVRLVCRKGSGVEALCLTWTVGYAIVVSIERYCEANVGCDNR